jgi:dihydrofolate reductase
VIGGANTGQQLINLGLLDELEVGIVPVLLGEGLRMFEHLALPPVELEKTRLLESPGRTDITFRIVK